MRIAVISDTHFAPSAAAFDANGRAAVAWAEAVGPDLVVHLGDVTADGVLDFTQFAHAHALLGGLSTPLRVTPGNHDVGDCPPGGAHEPVFDPAALSHFREAFGPDRWCVCEAGWRLIGLNAQLLGTDSEEEETQAAWLRETLRRGDERVALFLHKPLFLHAPEVGPDHPRYVPRDARMRLISALAHRELGLVVSGHAHQSRIARVGRTLHAWAPSTAFTIPDDIQPRLGRKRCGVMLVELGEGEPRVTAVTPPGLAQHDLLDHEEVYPQVAAMRARR